MIGLFAVSYQKTRSRTKEIGIRKINGANVFEILTMINSDFLRWAVIAFVIAAPTAWYAMYKWLESYAYKTELKWWIFALSGMIVVTISLLTVSWQSWQAATKNPVDALRYE
jgi:putative ABC transport system permease protein